MDALGAIFSRLCFVDVETTGLDPATEDILEVGLVFVERGLVSSRRAWLARPTRPIPPLITALTGLGDDDVRTARPWAEVAPEVHAALSGWTLVAHNATFERGFLGALLEDSAVIDSCELAALLFPELPSHSLDALLRHTGVAAGARHRALDDAEDTFLALSALVEAHLAERGESAPLREARRQLGVGASRDQAAMVTLLERIDAAPRRDTAPLPRLAQASVDGGLVQRIIGWLSARHRVAAELEARDVVAETVEAARRAAEAEAETTIIVAVPSSRLREPALSALAPVVPRLAVCRGALLEALRMPVNDGPSRLGRAYLARWLERTATGDVETVSGFVLKRGGDAKTLLRRRARCRCDDARCFARRAMQRSGPCLLLPHELALEWHGRGAPVRVVFLDAEQLPDAERRRLTRRHVVPAEATHPGHPQHELWAALGAMTPGPVDQQARAKPAWLKVREAALALARADASLNELPSLLEPPMPGFELFASAGALTLAPQDPARALRERLRDGVCLITGREGGLAWLGTGPNVTLPAPADGRQIAWEPAAISLEALPGVARRLAESVAGPVLLVSTAPMDDVAAACLAAGVEVSLDSRADVAVRLHSWAKEAPLPSTPACLFYGVRELRRAVLSTSAKRIVLASPGGLEREAVERALRGLL